MEPGGRELELALPWLLDDPPLGRSFFLFLPIAPFPPKGCPAGGAGACSIGFSLGRMQRPPDLACFAARNGGACMLGWLLAKNGGVCMGTRILRKANPAETPGRLQKNGGVCTTSRYKSLTSLHRNRHSCKRLRSLRRFMRETRRPVRLHASPRAMRIISCRKRSGSNDFMQAFEFFASILARDRVPRMVHASPCAPCAVLYKEGMEAHRTTSAGSVVWQAKVMGAQTG